MRSRNAKSPEKLTAFDQLTERLGVLRFKGKTRSGQKFTGRQRCFCCAPYWLWKEPLYQSFITAKEIESCDVDRPSCLVIVPLRSIIEEQINSNNFGMNVIGYVSQIAFDQMTREQFLPPADWYSVRSRAGSVLNISFRGQDINTLEALVVVAFLGRVITTAQCSPDKLAQGACFSNF